ncbi:hypothetical protein [Pedobacter glucosidilyticus]|uniref:hypothetical protein n=1 Tax=Pedobacter glucosidilyticus TaxID=1122941 RepID=UPI00047AD7FC|nr:hypothetical protein [Pedobacter glucosidilyticus]
METTFRLKLSELDENLLNSIKSLFKDDREINLTISSATDFDLNQQETKEEYFTRLAKAISNLDKGQGVTYTEEELNELVISNLKH